jgi:hypothetical protein
MVNIFRKIEISCKKFSPLDIGEIKIFYVMFISKVKEK